MRSRIPRHTLALRLGLAFAGVLAILFGALALVLVQSENVDRAYSQALSAAPADPGTPAGERRAEAVARARAASASQRTVGIVAGLLATLLAAGTGVLARRAIGRPMASVLACLAVIEQHDVPELHAALDAVAAGDLSRALTPLARRIENPGVDELGQIGRAVNSIRGGIHGSMSAYNALRDGLANREPASRQ